MNKEYISPLQLFYVTVGFTVGSSFIFTIGLQHGGRSTWIIRITATILGAFFLSIIAYLVKKFPQQNLLQILTQLAGPLPAKIMLTYYIFFAFLLAILVPCSLQEIGRSAVMPETPPWIHPLTFLLVTGYIVRHGPEVTARCCEIIMPLTIIVLGLTLIAGIFQINTALLLPAFAIDWQDFSKTLLLTTTFPIAEMFLLASFAILVKEKKKVFPSLLSGFILAYSFLTLRTLLLVGIFGISEATNLTFPTYIMFRTIKFGILLERIEIVLLFIWFFVIFVKTAVAFYSLLQGLSYLLKIPHITPLIYPLCILLIPLSYKGYENLPETVHFLNGVLPILTLPVWFLALPLLFFLSRTKSPSKLRNHE